MQPANKTKQEMKTSNYLALMAIVTVLVFVAGGFAIKTLGSSFLVNQKLISKKTVASQTLDNDLVAIKGIIGDYESLGAGAITINNIMPTDPDVPGLANAVEAMAGTSGATLKDVNNSALVGGAGAGATAGPQAVPVTISANVGYGNLVRFVSALEGSARPIRITSINMTGTNANLNLEVAATTYYQQAAKFEVATEVVK